MADHLTDAEPGFSADHDGLGFGKGTPKVALRRAVGVGRTGAVRIADMERNAALRVQFVHGLESSPQGVFVMGAHYWARRIAKAVQDAGIRVVMADSAWKNYSDAKLEGLEAYFGGILSEKVLDRVNLYGIGRLLATTSNEEANSLAAVHFADILGSAGVYQLSPHPDPTDGRASVSLKHLTGRLLFRREATFEYLSERFANGAQVKSTRLTKQFDYSSFRSRYGESALPLFLISDSKKLTVVTADREIKPRAGQMLIAVVDPVEEPLEPPPQEQEAKGAERLP